jgi:hypothetical protein
MKTAISLAFLVAIATVSLPGRTEQRPARTADAVMSATPQRAAKLPASKYTTTKRVLTGRNFKLKGAFYPPSHPRATNQGRPLAGRVVQTPAGPQFRLISGDHVLMEWVPPQPSMGPAFPTAQMLVDYGVPYGMYGGFAWQPVYSTIGDLTFAGVYVDQRTDPETLYVISSTYYNNNSKESEVNLLVSRRTPEGKWAPKGMYRTSRPVEDGGFGTRFGSGMTPIPDDFSDAVFGGRRLGIGFGGAHWQGIVWNSVSIGPAFFAMEPQTGTAPNHGYITGRFSPILFHPYHADAYVIPRIARRPRQAATLNKWGLGRDHPPSDPWVPKDGIEYWSTSDASAGGAWLDYPDLGLHGLAVISTNYEGSAHASVVSAQPTPGANNRTWDIAVRMIDGAFAQGMSIYVPSKDAPSYGGYEGVIAAVEGSTLRVYNGADYGPFSYAPTPGSTIIAGNWYGPGGPKNPLARTWLNIYDPVALAQQAVSGGPYSELDPANISELPFGLKRAYPLPGTLPAFATAIVPNPLNHDVYVMVDDADRGDGSSNIRMVYVYEIVP